MKYVYHKSQNDPCEKCGLPTANHRPDIRKTSFHAFVGNNDICDKCGLKPSRHKVRRKPGKRKPTTYKEQIRYVGIDGEGQGKKYHKYVLLAASDETGKHKWYVENYDGLTTVQCLDFILTLPQHKHKVFSFSFNYDLTKILTDLPDEKLYFLFRPELRPRKGPDSIKGPMPVKWGKYILNLQGTKFTIRKGKRKVIIWDLFKFFQGKFVNALIDWKVGTKYLWDKMQLMKEKRSEFDKETPEDIREYCLNGECPSIALLARKLIESHESVGLKLKSFYGAGSSGGAMLLAMGIKDKLPKMEMCDISEMMDLG